MRKLKTSYEFSDNRGEFIEVWRGNQWKEMNFFTAIKGSVRGSHYHKETTELFFVAAGRCEVEIINLESGYNEQFIAGYKDIFLVEPYEVHYIKAIEDLKVVTMLNKPYDKKNPDTYDHSK